ncbi:MAG: hypothetical protein ACK46Q_08930 [Hyphomonas sp.]
MIDYDRNKPLIFIHIPKTAGISLRTVFETWYGEGLLRHYANEQSGMFPEVIDLDDAEKKGQPVCLYGHFNRLRGFGIPGRYDGVTQFVTILRDPLEQSVSRYFYVRKSGGNWKDKSRVPQGDLETFLREDKPTLLIHFPAILTLDNYKDVIEEKFIAVGTTEKLSESMQLISRRLGFPYQDVPRLNVTERDQTISDAIGDDFRARHRLEYEVYDYCARRLQDQLEQG